MTPLILTNPDRTPFGEQPPEVQAAMKACAKAGARVECADPHDLRDQWENNGTEPWYPEFAYRIWPVVGEVREWRGGPCPVPEGAKVTVWLNGQQWEFHVADPHNCMWGHTGLNGDIVRYRVDALPAEETSIATPGAGRTERHPRPADEARAAQAADETQGDVGMIDLPKITLTEDQWAFLSGQEMLRTQAQQDFAMEQKAAFAKMIDLMAQSVAAQNTATLRDQFAMAAMNGLSSICVHDTVSPGGFPAHIAKNFYEVADAMLEARK